MALNSRDILVFFIDKQRFAIDIDEIDQVIRSTAVTIINNAPQFLEGIIDYHGQVIAVINMRKRLGYPRKEIELTDRFIIVNTRIRKLALMVDAVDDILSPNFKDISDSINIDTGLKFFNILRDKYEIVFIYDIEKLLGKSEEIDLQKILASFISANNKV